VCENESELGQQTREPPRTIAVALWIYSHAVHQREPEISHGSFLGVNNVAAGTERTAAFARENDRKIPMVVPHAVAIAVPEKDHRVVKQRGVTFFYGFHLLEEIGELLDDIVIDFADLLDFLGIARVMGQTVVLFRDADFSVRAAALFDPERECADAGNVLANRQNLQIRHQPEMIFEGFRNAHGPFDARGQFLEIGRRRIEAALDFSDRRQIFIHTIAVVDAKLPVEPFQVLAREIENAAIVHLLLVG